MRIRHKHTKCYNCEHKLLESYNYCPQCGQENNDNNISFNLLLREFFHNYFSLDSRFTRSLKPFFLKPGMLTNEYIAGKRVSYVNPVRLYLILSLFYFFMFGLAGRNLVLDDEGPNDMVKVKRTPELVTDSITSNPKLIVPPVINETDTIEGVDLSEYLSEEELDDIKQQLDSSGSNYGQEYWGKNYGETDSTDSEDKDGGFIISSDKWDLLDDLSENTDLNEQQIMDSLKIEDLSGFKKHIIRQFIRSKKADEEYFASSILKNLPIMMFLILPVFALILKLLYIRRRKTFLYIHHLIHSLHLHSLAYFFYGLAIIPMLFLFSEDSAPLFGFIIFLIVTYYAYRSFLRVYQQHWFKTLIKFLMLGGMYVVVLFVAFMAEMLISFLLF